MKHAINISLSVEVHRLEKIGGQGDLVGIPRPRPDPAPRRFCDQVRPAGGPGAPRRLLLLRASF